MPRPATRWIGRTLTLDHINRRGLQPEDPLFVFSPGVMNRQLQAAAVQVFGDRASQADGDLYRNITLYDLRHSGAIHLRLLAKENPGDISLDAIRHRGGWTNFDMLNYYTRFIGLDGRIERQGLLLRQEQHELEAENAKLKEEVSALKQGLQDVRSKVAASIAEIKAGVEMVRELRAVA